jgi:hypothetical protein
MNAGCPTNQVDRIINVGCPERPLATEDPTMDALLPTEDAEWDQGVRRS